MSSGKESLQEIKDKLTSYGISTSTPGFKGDDRLNELLNRLQEVQTKENEILKNDEKDISSEEKYYVPSVSDLSLSEIRSRLTMLGENTNTPGLSGEERRNELLKRLINCICRSEETGDQIIDEIVEEKKAFSNEHNIPLEASIVPSDIPSLEDTESQLESTNAKIDRLKKEERILATELSEIKKHMNNLINHRAIVISSRYEGTNQDEKLRKLGSYLEQVEHEISRSQNIIKKNRNGKAHSSSALVENNSMMPVEKLLFKLTKELELTKEKIKRQKNMIKLEEENNSTYGIEIEENDKVRIQEISYKISKIKRDIEKISVGVSVALTSSMDITPLNRHESQPKEFQRESLGENSSTAKVEGESRTKNKSQSHELSPGIGFSEEELFAMKPFEPYKETDSDDLLALKMEMLRNRQKASNVQRNILPIDSTKSSYDLMKDKEIYDPPLVGEKFRVSPEIGGSDMTAFSSRRPINRVPPARQASGSQSEERGDLADSPKGSITQGEEKISGECITEATASHSAGASDSKITRLREELSRKGDSDEEEESAGDDDEDVDEHLSSLRTEARMLEKNHDFDRVEEIYVKALNMKPLDIRTLDSFATFLYRRKGEMARAEAFYRRAIQISLPSLIDDLTSPSKKINYDNWSQILTIETPLPTHSAPPGSLSISTYSQYLYEEGKFSLPVKKLTSVLLHYANFLRRAKGDFEMAEVVLRKAAEISPHDDVILGNCAHHLAEEVYDHHESISPEKVEEYRRDASDLFRRAMKANPSNVMNMLWYAKFLHKTNQYIQAEIMYKAALRASNLIGKVGATAVCNYAIFLYRHKKDPEGAARLFCDGIERFPNHRGIQKNYRAMKKELEKAVSRDHKSPPFEEKIPRESNANTAKMAGMRAKLYNDVQSAEDYKLSEVEAAGDGVLSLSIHEINIHFELALEEELYVYWLFNAGSGSISDRSYESSVLPFRQNVDWKFSFDQNQTFPKTFVTGNDHVCFECYFTKKNEIEFRKSKYIGSVILPIEDLLHDHISQSLKSKSFLNVEEPIMSDDGEVVGQMKLHYLLQ